MSFSAIAYNWRNAERNIEGGTHAFTLCMIVRERKHCGARRVGRRVELLPNDIAEQQATFMQDMQDKAVR